MKHLRFVFATVLVLAAFAATPTQAADPTSGVRIGQCVVGGDATRAVPAGTDVVLGFSWGVKTRGLGIDFRHAVTVSVLIDGVAAANTGSYWLGPPQGRRRLRVDGGAAPPRIYSLPRR